MSGVKDFKSYEPAKASALPYPAAWGWNSSGRAGNVTEVAISEPRQVQRTKNTNFVSCAAGSHHSLLIDNNGRVYSFGDGNKGELGIGSEFGNQKPFKGGSVQALPRMVTPTGSICEGKDRRFIEVAAGGGFSVAREVSPDEGTDLVVGFRAMERSLKQIRRMYPESLSVQKAWAEVRQERFHIDSKSEGQVYTWGTGTLGQLGLDHVTWSPYPQRVLAFRDTRIVQVAAGAFHALAIDQHGRLYSWGRGKGGRLGHGDYKDRNEPAVVKFFNSLNVVSCSAGDSHSAVITSSRGNDQNNTQLRRVACFGRGAHGRLGNGTNRNQSTPVLVSTWPPSVAGVQFHQIACGGAHTVVVGYIDVPKGIANPWGRETFVLCWGYGANGQLGTGYRYDSYVPTRSRMPRCEPIEGVTAGRTWTVCRSIGGALYTFGKGLRGQLGQGKVNQFSLAPRKLHCAGAYLKIDAGNAHTVSIAIHKQYLNNSVTEDVARRMGALYDPFQPIIELSLKKSESYSKFKFDCCRIELPWNRFRSQRRFQCIDCGVPNMCIACARLCHRGHLLLDSDIDSRSVTMALQSYRETYRERIEETIRRNGNIVSPVMNLASGESTQKTAAAKVFSGKPGAAAQKIVEKQRVIDFYRGTLPHQCAMMSLLNHIRPRRYTLECMPRASIADVTLMDQVIARHPRVMLRSNYALEEKLRKERRKAARQAEKEAAEATIAVRKAAQKDRLRRIRLAKEFADADKKPRVRFEIDSSIKEIAKGATNILTSKATELKHSRSTAPDKNEQIPVAGSESVLGQLDNHHTLSKEPFCSLKQIECCRCGLFNTRCRLLPMIPEDPFESLLAAREVVRPPKKIAKKTSVLPESKASVTAAKSPQRRIISLIPSKKVMTASVKKPVTSLFSRKSQAKQETVAIAKTPAEEKEEAAEMLLKQKAMEMNIQDELKRKEIQGQVRRTAAVHVLQRTCRFFLQRMRSRRARIEIDIARHKVCKAHYYDKIVGTVFRKVDRVYARFRENREVQQMGHEEQLMRKYLYYCRLQTGLIAIEAMKYSARQLYGYMSTFVPRVADGKVTNAYRPTHAFTWRSVRSQQLYLQPARRMPIDLLNALTVDLPRTRVGALGEGIVCDSDMNNFLIRFLRDRDTEDWRQSIYREEHLQREARRKAAAAALERLRQKQNAKKLAMLQAEAITLALKNGLPPPPPGPPPRHVIRAAREKEKAARNAEVLAECKEQLRLEDAPFNVLEKGFEVKHKKRRYSIADPTELNSRLCSVRHRLQSSTRSKRTFSLPDLNVLYVETKPAPTDTITSVKESLNQYQLKLDYLTRVSEGVERAQVDPLYAGHRPEHYFERQIRLLFEHNFLDPRLPLEMQTLLRNGYRRRTIGEPERMHRQLQILLDIREKFSDFVERSQELYGIRRRRRSFDHGELLDQRTGIEMMLGYEYEEATPVHTTTGLRRDGVEFEYRMYKAGFIEVQNCSVPVRQRIEQQQYREERRVTKSKLANFASSSGSSKRFSGRFGGGGSSKKGNFFSAARDASEKFYDEYGDQFAANSALSLIDEGYFGGSYDDDGGYTENTANAGSVYTPSNYGTVGDSSHDVRGFNYQQDYYQQSYDDSLSADAWSGWEVQSQYRNVWQEHYTDGGQAYYYNEYTGESRWDFPGEVGVELETQNEDENGNWYWFNTSTGESRWMEY